MTLKLIVLDCDGVLSAGEARPFDLALLARLAQMNRRARRGEPIPAVTLNTGRPSPYVEAVMQAIDGWQPALFESGAGLYFPQTYRFITTPLFSPAHAEALAAIIAKIDETLVASGRAYWQPGKTVCHSLFARHPHTVADFLADVQQIAQLVSPEIMVKQAKLTLNIYPASVHKGTGLRWLADVTGISPTEMGGIGDTAGDLDFLRMVSFSAAPANATSEVRRTVAYVSPFADALGTNDILDYWQSRSEK